MTFDVGLAYPARIKNWGGGQSIEQIDRVVLLAEECGYYAVNFGDRLVTPFSVQTIESTLSAGQSPSGLMFYDPFVLSSHVLSITKRLRTVWGVVNVTLRPAAVMAKAVATLDVISQGRVIFGLGVGGGSPGRSEQVSSSDPEVVGVPFKERGLLANEYIKAMKVLWTQERCSFEGKFINFRDVEAWPKPVQKPHPPLWIGGDSPRAMRRTWELGDGWLTHPTPFPELGQKIQKIKDEAKALGRDPTSMAFGLGMGVGPPPRDRNQYGVGNVYFQTALADTPERAIDLIGRYREVGINHLSIRWVWDTPMEYLHRMEWFAARVMPAFR